MAIRSTPTAGAVRTYVARWVRSRIALVSFRTA